MHREKEHHAHTAALIQREEERWWQDQDEILEATTNSTSWMNESLIPTGATLEFLLNQAKDRWCLRIVMKYPLNEPEDREPLRSKEPTSSRSLRNTSALIKIGAHTKKILTLGIYGRRVSDFQPALSCAIRRIEVSHPPSEDGASPVSQNGLIVRKLLKQLMSTSLPAEISDQLVEGMDRSVENLEREFA